jgi:hypothetical protein
VGGWKWKGRRIAMRIPDDQLYNQLYERTPSQAEGERDDLDGVPNREVHAEVPRTTPSQAEGEYEEEGQPPRTQR